MPNNEYDYKINGIPVFIVGFKDFIYLISLFKNNKRLLTREITDQRLTTYIKINKNNSNNFYFKHGDIIVDFRTYKQ